MKEEKLEKLLTGLTNLTEEPVSDGLAEDIKKQIPRNFASRHKGLKTVNIIIDFRINKLAAAAAIVVTLILCAGLLGTGNSGSSGLYQEGKLLIQHFLGGDNSTANNLSIGLTRYKYLLNQGEDVVYYGEVIGPGDSNSILLHCRLSDGNYKVLFADLHEWTVDAEQLIKLQVKMLQRKNK
ncbi:MAG: hypothetical protein ACYSSI_12565 [Planctomycetota bacterium]|jgi:hypothetical protein